MTDLLVRSDVQIIADPRRVVARLFVPGHERFNDGESRATGVLARVLGLTQPDVARSLEQVRQRFEGRHRDLGEVLRAHFKQIAHRIPDGDPLTSEHQDLIGAVFTNEFAIEGAALFNPSVVLHPDQNGIAPDCCRILLSLRAVGEGHISSVEFRSGVLGPGRQLTLDPAGPHVEVGAVESTWYDRDLFEEQLEEQGADAESARYLIWQLPIRFETIDLDRALEALGGQEVTRPGSPRTAELARHLARCSYEVSFPEATGLSERVLWPQAPTETTGMEDVRLVRFTDADGGVSYLGTYTAFDGTNIAPQLIETTDFRRFRVSQLAGPAAKDKGMALFPRLIGGKHVALSRADRESSGITESSDGRRWGIPKPLSPPGRAWELVQTGNCGSPLETEAGWLVLTHGVGPMREYAIGALLLDLDDPTKVRGSLVEPLLSPAADERDGYVPNVVYSCGSLLFGDVLLLPYGASDASVRFAFVDVPQLIELLQDS